MPICITGMHRSGTSLTARLLHSCGLYLGEEEDLLQGAADNPDGFWEHARLVELHDTILSYLGGGWDVPPEFPPKTGDHGLDHLQEYAQRLTCEFQGHEPWGWKDPRSSLIMPMWLRILDDLRVVIVVRNPLEVAESLHRRNFSSHAHGLWLWAIYNQRLLDSVPPNCRIVTHYNSYFRKPAEELRRLATHLDLPVSEQVIESGALVDSGMRHNRYTTANLSEASVSPHVLELYRELCALAGWSDDDVSSSTPRPGASLRSEVGSGADADRKHDTGPTYDGAASTLRIGQLDRSLLQADTIRELQRLLEDRTGWAQRSAKEIREREAEINDLRAKLTEQAQRMDRVLASFDCMAGVVAEIEPVVRPIRQAMRGCIPAGSVVLVASKGDDALLQVETLVARHFPIGEGNEYAGYHPADSDDLLARLEDMQAAGAQYFVLPGTAFWWLESYPGFRTYLDEQTERVWSDAHCLIVRLRQDSISRET